MAPAPTHALDSIVIKGAREHNLKNIDLTLPRNRLIVITGLSGSGKSLARLRHDLRRGPAPLRRVALVVRPAVPRARWRSPTSTTSRGSRRRSRSTRSRPRATRARRSARSPRSTTTCGCCSRASACRTVTSAGARSARNRAEQIVDQIMELPEGTRIQLLAPVIRGRKGEYAEALRGDRQRGLRARPDRRRDPRTAREDRPRQEEEAHDRGRRRPARDEGRHSQAPHRLDRDDAAALDRHRRRALRSAGLEEARGADVQRSVRLRVLRAVVPGARAAAVLVQLAVRRVPGVQRARREDRDRSVEGDPGSHEVDRRRRDRAVVASRSAAAASRR